MNTTFDTPGPVEQYLRHLEQGRFMLQRSRQSGEYFYYPRAFAKGAPSHDLEWVEMSGDGTVYSTTTVRRKPEHGGDYDISLVQLDEGPRILTRVLGIEPDKVKIGMKVKARIEKPAWDPKATRPLVVFYPA
jgi:uncharacterized OB-fold protein